MESLSISQRYLNPHCVVRLGNVPQASHLQSVQVVAHTNRQLVGGSSSSGADEPSSWNQLPAFLQLTTSIIHYLSFFGFSFSSFTMVKPPSPPPTPLFQCYKSHTHVLLTPSPLPTAFLFPSPLYMYMMDTVEKSIQPLSSACPCPFYTSLIRWLMSSMAVVKETAQH